MVSTIIVGAVFSGIIALGAYYTYRGMRGGGCPGCSCSGSCSAAGRKNCKR